MVDYLYLMEVVAEDIAYRTGKWHSEHSRLIVRLYQFPGLLNMSYILWLFYTANW